MKDSYDIVVIGGGPAGISAALTAVNRGKTVAVIANPPETSALWKAKEISNYPGFAAGSGQKLLQSMRAQLEASEAEVISGKALSVMPLGGSFGIAVQNEFTQAKAVILAAGVTREKLYPGESEFLGRGVSYCATCDGMLYREKTVAVIGAGEEAAHEADFLEEIGCTVLRFTGNARYEIHGNSRAEKLLVNGESYAVDCVFILKDTVSVTQLVPGLEYADGKVSTERNAETALPGVFAAGDCTGKPYQLAKAVGEGNLAALAACEYIEK